MVRLSIVIPVVHDIAGLESTLVTVLSNRPADCEIVVVLNAPYDDPYALADEVRFVSAPRGANWAACANLGLRESRASIVHVLDPGVEVCEGWTEPAVRHFRDAQVATVSPLLLNATQRDRVLSNGVQYQLGGERRLAGNGISASAASTLKPALGPTAQAGFYRRSAIYELLGGFEPTVGAELCDVDLAMRVKQSGYQTNFEPRSRLYASATTSEKTRGVYRYARCAERLFWRNVNAGPKVPSIAAHLGVMAKETVRKTMHSPALLCGRLFSAAEIFSYWRHHRRMKTICRQVAISLALADSVHKERHFRTDAAESSLGGPKLKPRTAQTPRRLAA